MPFFSIIIPLYNKQKFIENTIQSALNQTFLDFELIVVNDGSTDRSLELVKAFKDQRIKYIPFEMAEYPRQEISQFKKQVQI